MNKSFFGFEEESISRITGVKSGTIRFYEKCDLLETVSRLPIKYRIFNEHHIIDMFP